MRARATLTATIAAAALAGAILLPSAAGADTSIYCSPGCDIVVNSTVDAPDADPGDETCATAAGACSLRAAVQEGNAAGVANVLVPPATFVLSRHGLDDDASHGDLDVEFHGQLVGAGPSKTVVNGDDADRVFDLHIGEVRIAHLTVRDGRATDGPGGGIRTGAGDGFYASLEYLRVTDNKAVAGEAAGSGNGGGIGASKDTLVTNSLVDHNDAVNGGGMYWAGGQADTGRNTFANNHASGDGGGIYLTGFDTGFGLTTISGNRADGHGGGARVRILGSTAGFLRLGASTIASNSAPSGMGGGLWIDGAPPDESASTVQASIIAGNGGGGDCAGGARLDSSGGNVDGDGSCGFQDPTDRAQVDPLLGPLADNGGPTPTRELLEGSPAIDLWSTNCEGTDQRFAARPQGAACDSGAFEVGQCCPAYEAPYVPSGDPPYVLPPDEPREGDCGVLRLGTLGADVLAGDRRHNQIYGRAGDDSIYGRAHSDCLYGGAGDDFVRGGAGSDLLVGFTGADHLSGGDQEDVVRGGRGPDRILGGADEDRLLGGPGADYVKGGDGYDSIEAGPGDDSIDATGGGLDTVDCGGGDDRVRAKRGERLAGCEHVHYVDGAA